MKSGIITTLFLALMMPALLPAQQKISLDLEGAKKQAIEFNKSLLNAEYAVEKSQLAIKEAIANGLPQINAAMDYSNALGASISIRFNPDMPASEIPIKPQSNLNINLGQLLFSGNYIVGVQLAKLYNGIAQKNLKKSEIEILAQVSDGYYLILVSEELLKVIRLNLENLEILYKKNSPNGGNRRCRTDQS